MTDRDDPSLFVSSRHIGDGVLSCNLYDCLRRHYFRTRHIVTLFWPVYLCCLWGHHDPSRTVTPLITLYGSGVLNERCFRKIYTYFMILSLFKRAYANACLFSTDQSPR